LFGLTAMVTITARQVAGLESLIPALLLAVMFGSTILLPWGAGRRPSSRPGPWPRSCTPRPPG
jgi:hypothetical protein